MNDLSQFKTFDEVSLSRAANEAMKLLNEMSQDSTPRWLSLTGISGLGKTYLSKIILKAYRDRIGPFRRQIAMDALTPQTRRVPRFSSHFCKWRDVVTELRNGNWGIIQDLKEVTFLVIDDIGDEDESKMSAGKLYDLIDGRLGKWTIITSNQTVRDISTKDRRLASRMIRDGNIQIELKGEDFSIRKLKGES